MTFDAVILDVDGVVTRTATQHEYAWRQLFGTVLSQHGDLRPFTHQDYLTYVDGKSRTEGLRAFLSARGIDIGDDQLKTLAEQKNRLFLQRLDDEGVEVFDDAVRQIRLWRGHGMGIAFVSSSENAARVLAAAGVLELSHVRVDGQTARELGLSGKRELLAEAARRLDVEIPMTLVIEDSVAGVEAATRLGFGLVVGVAREGNPEALLRHGAHRVVRRLDEIAGAFEPGTRRGSELPSALPFDGMVTRFEQRLPALLLDFDGTLTPIVSHPDRAVMSDEMRGLVQALAKRCHTVIISGRDREDVERRVAIDGPWYVGGHGFDVRSPDGEVHSPLEPEVAAVTVAQLDRAEERLRHEIGDEPGIVLERKHFGLATHYRMCSSETAERAVRLVNDVAADSTALRTHIGERVIELLPIVAWDKGKSALHILQLWGLDEVAEVPVYLGDGRTDEDAFRVLQHRGINILVGAAPRPTHADLGLSGPDEVGVFLRQLLQWIDRRGQPTSWSLHFEGWNPGQQQLREALCTLGNGYVATRGAAEEAQADAVHYPGTYLAGGYDRITSEVRGEPVENEDLVNWPNWLPLTFRPKGGEWLSLEHGEVSSFLQELDLARGELIRRVRFRDRDGRETALSSRRLVSMDDPHAAALQWEITPLNWSGAIEVRSGINGTVENDGVARYRALRGQHLVPDSVGHAGPVIWLSMRTRQSRIRACYAAKATVLGLDPNTAQGRVEEREDRVDLTFALEAVQGAPIRVEKLVALHTSRDPAISEPIAAARQRLGRYTDYGALRSAHARAWARLWRRCDIQLGEQHEETNRLLRLHIFHLLQVASPHIIGHDVGVPARGLHGEAYRGHIFWDELFIFPFLNYSVPELTRELLMYRHRRLDAARWRANDLGHVGAAYPWQSGSSGREESQTLHLNPKSSRWIPDETHLQYHVNAAVGWNVWQYHEVSGDHEFLSFHGAEMLVEIARFWASIAEWDAALGRYRIRGVVGPDEFHTRYPGADRPGVDDNAYTNVMAAWCLRCAERALCELGNDRSHEIMARLGITAEDRRLWSRVASKLRVVFHGGHIISQFDGYDDLKEFDWAAYTQRYGDIQRLDRILEAEGETPNAYKVGKQADVLMLFFLFSADELVDELRAMGYSFEPQWIPENVKYYASRTSHGSTLSRVVHSWVLARADRAGSFRLFQQALRSDVSDVQGGTTPEGIHLGAMAGTVDLVKRAYTGARMVDGVLWLEPRLPDELPELRTRFRVRGAWLDVFVSHDAVEVEHAAGHALLARVGLAGRVRELPRGARCRIIRQPPA